MCAVDPVCVTIMISGFQGLPLSNFHCLLFCGYLSGGHLHLICRTESQDVNVRTRIFVSSVPNSKQPGEVVEWVMLFLIRNLTDSDTGTEIGHLDYCFSWF